MLTSTVRIIIWFGIIQKTKDFSTCEGFFFFNCFLLPWWAHQFPQQMHIHCNCVTILGKKCWQTGCIFRSWGQCNNYQLKFQTSFASAFSTKSVLLHAFVSHCPHSTLQVICCRCCLTVVHDQSHPVLPFKTLIWYIICSSYFKYYLLCFHHQIVQL